MPATLSYPGVYVEEIPSGVRTITGVATSITAFLGRTGRGPVNTPVPIFGFGDYERQFGGLNAGEPLGYAVKDFFQNGGAQAVIVRVFHEVTEAAAQAAQAVADKAVGADAAAAAAAALAEANKDAFKDEPLKSAAQAIAKAADQASKAAGANPEKVKLAAQLAANAFKPYQVTVDSLTLRPASPGAWANKVTVKVDHQVSQGVADRFGVALGELFNLTISDGGTGATEKLLNLTTRESPRRVDRVLASESQLLRWDGEYPNPSPNVPADGSAYELGKGLREAEATLAQATQAKNALPATATQPEKDAAEATRAAAEQARDDARKALDMAVTAQDSRPLSARDYQGSETGKTGLYALEDADLFNLLCIPADQRDGDTDPGVYSAALDYCVKRRAFLLVDPPGAWHDRQTLLQSPGGSLSQLGLTGDRARNGALYYPRVLEADPMRENQIFSFVPCGVMAGVMARTDTQRGVWKAPAGIDASLNGVSGLDVLLTDPENGLLNQVGINALRTFPVYGRISWGARTLRGADQSADEYKYIPVRRTALFIEESLYRGLKWVVFEPNDEPLWAQIRLNVGAFMHNLFRQGAFQGSSPREAYFVKCDRDTTTQNDINLGIVNVVVGFAPLKPAEFVVLKVQQIAGQIEV